DVLAAGARVHTAEQAIHDGQAHAADDHDRRRELHRRAWPEVPAGDDESHEADGDLKIAVEQRVDRANRTDQSGALSRKDAARNCRLNCHLGAPFVSTTHELDTLDSLAWVDLHDRPVQYPLPVFTPRIDDRRTPELLHPLRLVD